MIRFGRYQLDPGQGLMRGKRELRLTPKSLSVLRVLAERRGQVVTKEEIFRAVWPEVAVTDSALTTCIQELRHALGDDARRPRFIETVHRRGYRFLTRTVSSGRGRSRLESPIPPAHPTTPLVGRDAVLDKMLEAYVLAERGVRQVLFVTGEPGVGKTTVVDACLARVAGGGSVRATLGQCLEHYGVGEPYQPLLEALTRLCRQPAGVDCIQALQRYAPTWLAQLPSLLPPDTFAALPRTVAGTTPERMLRELNDAVDAMTARETLVLWLEDLHWSDASTMDWIAAFAQRPEPARVLLVATFRTSEVAGTDHPLADLADRLRVKGFCREIALGGLDEGAVVEYVVRRFPAAPGSSEAQKHLARMVHQRTGGNPLFVINVLSDLIGRGLFVERDGAWTAHGDLGPSDLAIPDDVRRMIERQIEQLRADERGLLEIASVAGASFSSAAVAAGARLPLGDVETTLAALARTQRFVRETSAIEWPDGTVAAGFEFLHALYRDVLYQRIPAGRRAELHREIGTREEKAYGERSSDIATELAMHFEQSRDLHRAADYLQQSAENARRCSAYKEARMHFERALLLVERQPAGRVRIEREVTLRIGLGGVMMATLGWAASEVEDAYVRARALCRELGETPRLFPSLWGLWLFYWGRGPLSTAHELSEHLLALANQAGDRTLRLQSHHASWATAFSRGEFEATLSHATAGLSLYEADRDAVLAGTYGGHDAGVCSRYFSARALALMGRTDEAVRTSQEAIAHARNQGHPFSLALAHVFAAAVDQARRDPASTRGNATAAARIAREQDFRLILAWASVFEGWAAVEEGRREEGVKQIDRGVAETLATGSQQFVSHFLSLLAAARLGGGEHEAGRKAVDEALGIVRHTGERFYEAELHRLRGELLFAANPTPAAGGADEAFAQAIDVARSQGAKLLALRAAISRARLWGRLGRGGEARQLVRSACGDLAEGLPGPDWIEARALLAE